MSPFRFWVGAQNNPFMWAILRKVQGNFVQIEKL